MEKGPYNSPALLWILAAFKLAKQKGPAKLPAVLRRSQVAEDKLSKELKPSKALFHIS